jgi:hypothetical protein
VTIDPSLALPCAIAGFDAHRAGLGTRRRIRRDRHRRRRERISAVCHRAGEEPAAGPAGSAIKRGFQTRGAQQGLAQVL